METKLLNDVGEATYALVFDIDEEVVAGLTRFAVEKNITAGHFTAIGAFSKLTLGYFDWQAKDYTRIAVNEQVEVLSLIGDIAIDKGKPKLHAHVVVGKSDGTAHGGHLLEAYVRPTLEVVLESAPARLVRRHDPESGLALIDLASSRRSQ